MAKKSSKTVKNFKWAEMLTQIVKSVKNTHKIPKKRYDITVTSFWAILAKQNWRHFFRADLAKNFEKVDVTLNFCSDFRTTNIFFTTFGQKLAPYDHFRVTYAIFYVSPVLYFRSTWKSTISKKKIDSGRISRNKNMYELNFFLSKLLKV